VYVHFQRINREIVTVDTVWSDCQCSWLSSRFPFLSSSAFRFYWPPRHGVTVTPPCWRDICCSSVFTLGFQSVVCGIMRRPIRQSKYVIRSAIKLGIKLFRFPRILYLFSSTLSFPATWRRVLAIASRHPMYTSFIGHLDIGYNTANVLVPSLQKHGRLCITMSVNIWDNS